MQHGERRRAQAPQRLQVIEITDDGHDPMGAQPGNVFGAARETVKANLRMEQIGGPKRDVAAADQQ